MPEYDFAVWGTQGGGLVREVHGIFIFVEPPPDSTSLTVGSEMPKEWGTVPANDLAHRQIAEEEKRTFEGLIASDEAAWEDELRGRGE